MSSTTDPAAPAAGGGTAVALVSPAVAAAAVAGGALLIDVRSAAGRAAHGGLPQAVVVDKPAAVDVVPTLAATDAPVVVICGSEAGSGPVAEALATAGFTALAHVAGGFPAWKAAGFATTPPTADQA